MAFPDFPCIIDDFNRANGGAGANWTTGIDGGATALVVNGNQLRCNSTGTFGSIYFNVHQYPADVQFYVTTGASFGTGGSLATVYARVQGAGTANYDGYAVEGSATSTNWSIKLYRVDNGVLTQLGSTASGVGTWVGGDAIGIECTGTTIRAYSREGTGGSWTQEISQTDSTYQSGGHTGLSLNVSATNHDLEDFSGGPITPTSSGALSSGTQTSDNEFGTTAWTNPGNAASSNDSYATASLGASGTSQYLAVTNFSANVSASDTIVGIKLDVERKAGAGSTMVDNSIKLYNGGTAIGNDKPDSSIFWPTSDEVKSYFYHPSAWGGSVDVSMVNGSGFGAAISAFNISGTVVASVDHVTITIYSFSASTDATVDGEAGSATAAGQAATPQATVPGAAGSATAAGQAASVVINATVTGATGSATAAGQTAALTASVPGTAGSVTAAGQNATLTVVSTITGTTGSATAAGQAASLVISSTIVAEAGLVTVNGHAAAAGSVTIITAEAGSATASGQAASVVISSTVSAETGNATAAGQAATVTVTAPGAMGSATATGQAAALTALLVAVAGAATAAGQAASLTISSTVTAEAGSATATGSAATVTTVTPSTNQRLRSPNGTAHMLGDVVGIGHAVRRGTPEGGTTQRQGAPPEAVAG